MLKVALLLGVEVHPGTSFEGLIEPPPPPENQEKHGKAFILIVHYDKAIRTCTLLGLILTVNQSFKIVLLEYTHLAAHGVPSLSLGCL